MEKVTNRCLHFTTSLILYKQKLSTPILTNSYLELTRRKEGSSNRLHNFWA